MIFCGFHAAAVEIDTLVGKRGRSAFLTQAAEKELMRLRQIKALEGAAGAWKDKTIRNSSREPPSG